MVWSALFIELHVVSPIIFDGRYSEINNVKINSMNADNWKPYWTGKTLNLRMENSNR